jgi:hypothetical protein
VHKIKQNRSCPFTCSTYTNIKLIKLSSARFTHEGVRRVILVHIDATLYQHKRYIKLYQTSHVAQKHFTVQSICFPSDTTAGVHATAGGLGTPAVHEF